MDINDLARDYVVNMSEILGDAISEYLKKRNDELYILIEKPVLKLLKHYSFNEPNWQDFYENVDFIMKNPKQAKSFFKERKWIIDDLENTLKSLRNLNEEEFYEQFYKIYGVINVFNNVFDTISYIKLGVAIKGDFYF